MGTYLVELEDDSFALSLLHFSALFRSSPTVSTDNVSLPPLAAASSTNATSTLLETGSQGLTYRVEDASTGNRPADKGWQLAHFIECPRVKLYRV
jgi:hypothetical protein